MQAHLAHGDLFGACGEHCEVVCDDADPCTIDACEPGTGDCAIDHPPVDCNDSNLCTEDTCSPVSGCVYAPVVCEDGDFCTIGACNPLTGDCSFAPVDCGPYDLCDPATGDCYDPCSGTICDPISQCHSAGTCSLGDCLAGGPLPDGTPCNDGDSTTAYDVCVSGECHGSGAPCVLNLTAYYPFDGGAAADDSGNGNDGVIQGGASWTTGYLGDALEFHYGTTSAVSIPRTVFDGFANTAYFEAGSTRRAFCRRLAHLSLRSAPALTTGILPYGTTGGLRRASMDMLELVVRTDGRPLA